MLGLGLARTRSHLAIGAHCAACTACTHTTMSVTQPLSTALAPTATQTAQGLPPIAQVVPVLSAIATFVVAAVSKSSYALIAAISWVSHPILALLKAPLPFVLYLISPLVLFIKIVLGIFFVIPYNGVVDFFVAVQPFYVFCGVACISGAVIGLGGRMVAGFISEIILGPEEMQGEPLGPSLDEQLLVDEKPKRLI